MVARCDENQARRIEVMVERDIVAARSSGSNVTPAQLQKWLGSAALAQGDRVETMRHFNPAGPDLRVDERLCQLKRDQRHLLVT
jgi:hypothetical protein